MAAAFPITVDASHAIAKFDAIPESVRNRLRVTIPGLTKTLQSGVQAKLAPGVLFKTTPKWVIRAVMVENSKEIVGRVFVDPASPDGSAIYAAIHEFGGKTGPHTITAVNAAALYFFWAKLGKNVMFKTVHHPGSVMQERSYMRSTFDEQRADIVEELTEAVKEASAEAH
jgi:hypothetical protein